MKEKAQALIDRINKIGNGGANAEAIQEVKDLASDLQKELDEEE